MSQFKKKVSVIIPIYNVENYIKKSILSILNQTLKEIEIILINDGSTDSSPNIIKEIAKLDTRIQIISNPNQGLSIARNLGIYKAQGEYIYFFDSDDLLESDTLENCYNKCQSNNLDFLFFDADVFSDEGIDTNKFSYTRADLYEDKVYIGTDILNKQINDITFRSSSCLNFINRKYLSDIQLYFYPKIIHEDELFTFILYLKANRVGLIKAKYFHRRVRFNSIMSNNISTKNIDGYLTVCRELKYYYIKYGTTTFEKIIIRKRVNQLLNDLLNMTKYTSLKEQLKIKEIINYEFSTITDLKFKLKLRLPYIYKLLLKIKHYTS